MAAKKAQDPQLRFADAVAWERWLAKHAGASSGVWLEIAKAGSGGKSVSYAEALEVALCWGWIDGQKRALDETAWLQRFTPRGKRSIWSKINREKVARLIAEGRMKPAGLAEIERAKGDGRWDAAYDSPRSATVPEDLASALAQEPRARAAFEALDSANRYAILFRLHHAKKPETRARKVAGFVEMLLEGRTLHPRRAAGATRKARD